MVLTMEDLMLQEGYTIHENFMSTEPELDNQTLFSISLGIIRENDAVVHRMLYGDEIPVNEFEMDGEEIHSFGQFIKKIIQLFIRGIKTLFEKFWAFINRLFKNDKAIERYEDQLRNYTGTVDMHGKEHYIFTYLDRDIPRPDLKLNFQREYDQLADILYRASKYGNKAEIITKFNEIANEMNRDLYGTGDYARRARQAVFAGTYEGADVGADRYSNELFKMFRNWSDMPRRGVLDNYEVHNAIERFMNRKALIKNTERHKHDIENSAKDIERKTKALRAQSIVTSKECEVDYDVQYALDQILQIKCQQLQTSCNIYTLAFSAKLDAIKAALVQDRIVLFNAIDQMLKGSGKNL